MKIRELKNKMKWRAVSVTLTLLTLVTTMVACNNSNNGRNSTARVPGNFYYGNGIYNGGLCSNCGGAGSWSIFVGTDSESGLETASVGLDFYGNPMAGFNFYDPKIPVIYNGPVVAKGMLTINYQDSLLCNIPVGQYQMMTVSQGQWQSGIISSGYSGYGPVGLKFEARSNNGLSLLVSLPKAVIYNPTGTISWHPNRLSGTLVIERVNGMPCTSMSGMPAAVELY